MSFQAIQKTYQYTQTNEGAVQEVFPLLCPVREADWLEGWQYKMIYSESGWIEQNCVFSTPHHGALETIWHVTQYDPVEYLIEFVRLTPNENVVRINIRLEAVDHNKTLAHIDYQYTALNESQNNFIKNELEASFLASMQWWEKAINYYLKTGDMLRK